MQHLLGMNPIVKVILQEPIASGKQQILKHFAIIHDVQHVKHIIPLIPRRNHTGHDQILNPEIPRHQVVGIRGLQLLVLLVAQNTRRQVVKAEQIGDLVLFVDDGEALDDFVSVSEPVLDFFFGEMRFDFELGEVGVDEVPEFFGVFFEGLADGVALRQLD